MFRSCEANLPPAATSSALGETTLFQISSRIEQTSFVPQQLVDVLPRRQRDASIKVYQGTPFNDSHRKGTRPAQGFGHLRGHLSGVILVTVGMGGVTARAAPGN